MKLLTLIALILPLGFLSSCIVNPKKENSDPRREHLLIEDAYLSSTEQEHWKALARRGDAGAALNLAQYFLLVVNDYETARYWYKMAADNGGVREKKIYRSYIEAMKESEK